MKLDYGWREAIGTGIAVMPIQLDCLWFLRDPVFAGLHSIADIADGRSYRDTGHTLYPWHIEGPADRRLTTVVLPERPEGIQRDIETVIHEAGHVVDWMFGFERVMLPVSSCAETHQMEAFAEAFTEWVLPSSRDSALNPDDELWLVAMLV